MLSRVSIGFALAWMVFLLSGCGTRIETKPEEDPAPADVQQVTLHVQDMAKRLDINCPD